MLKLEKSEGGTPYYTANGPLTYRDINKLMRRPYISLIKNNCRMWWQGEKFSSFLFNNNPGRGDQRFPYDRSDPTALERLNSAWNEFTGEL